MQAWTDGSLEELSPQFSIQQAEPLPTSTPATITTRTRRTEAAQRMAECELKHLAFLSHDLSNNLGGVTLHLKLLRQRLAAAPEFAEELVVLRSAQQAIDQTTEGMRRLLTYSQLRGREKPPLSKPVDLHRLVNDLCLCHSGLARAKGLEIVVEVPPEATVRSDPELIVLVLQNLLGNSVKYARQGVIRLRCEEVSASRGGGCVLTVSDQGPGIPRVYLDQMCRRFRCGKSHGEHGVGLGLVIAAEAAKRLGADLSVQSKVGVGTTFSVALPQEPSQSSTEN